MKVRFSFERAQALKSIEDAIFKATSTLMLSGVFSSMYLIDVIEEMHASGAYMHITEDTMLCHARPSKHVHEPFVAYLQVESPVMFEDDAIKHVFVLGAQDSGRHLQLLSRVSHYISSHEHYDELSMAEAFKEPLEEDDYGSD